MSTNPNWPILEYAISWAAGPNQSPVQDFWSDVSARTEGQVQVTRGKQYELDQVQPGQMDFTLRNDDGAFDPGNTASLFAGQVLPYRLVRLRAQWPGTINVLTADQATAGKASGMALGSTLPGYTGTSFTASLIAGTSSYNKYSVAVPANPTAGQSLVEFTGWAVAAGQTYTAQCQATGSTTLSVQMSVIWVNAAGTLLSTSSGTAAALSGTAAQFTVTATAPAGACGAVMYLANSNAPTGASTAVSWQYQIEKNSSPSAWVQPGTWYPIFTGYVERWPQSWTSGGNYGTVGLTAVDLFSFLANRGMRGVFEADALNYGPNFMYMLDEAAGSTVFVDATGIRGNAVIVRTAVGQTIVPGQSLASQDNAPGGTPAAITGMFLGAQGPAVQSNTPASGSGSGVFGGGGLLIPPDPSTGNVGVPLSGGFTRIIAAKLAAGVNGGQYVWSVYMPGYAAHSGQMFEVAIFPGGNTYMQGGMYSGSNSCLINFPIPALGYNTTLYDGDWHLYGVSLSSDGKTVTLWTDLNGNVTSFNNGTSLRPPASPSGSADIIGATSTSASTAASNFIGSLAFAMEYPFEMNSTVWANLSNSWRNAWSTSPAMSESSGQRYSRIVNWIGYSGPTRISPGMEQSYGPASDIQGGTSPTAALQALQNVVDTEAGQHFVAADGTLVFQARSDRYNQTPTVTFGEHAGEVPYTDAQFDFDPTRIANGITVTQAYGNALYSATDSGSIQNYGKVTLQRTVNTMDPLEATAASQYFLYQNRQPLQRLEALPVDVAANPSVWPTLLGLDLGACVGVNRRPSNAPTVTLNGFLEQVVWTFGEDLTATWAGQVSNGALHQFAQLNSTTYGRLGADGNTLNATITAAATSLAVATAAGKPTFSTTSGDYPMSILLDGEQITLTAVPGGSTSPQTFTGISRGVNNTTPAAHTAGAAVSVVGTAILAY